MGLLPYTLLLTLRKANTQAVQPARTPCLLPTALWECPLGKKNGLTVLRSLQLTGVMASTSDSISWAIPNSWLQRLGSIFELLNCDITCSVWVGNWTQSPRSLPGPSWLLCFWFLQKRKGWKTMHHLSLSDATGSRGPPSFASHDLDGHGTSGCKKIKEKCAGLH